PYINPDHNSLVAGSLKGQDDRNVIVVAGNYETGTTLAVVYLDKETGKPETDDKGNPVRRIARVDDVVIKEVIPSEEAMKRAGDFVSQPLTEEFLDEDSPIQVNDDFVMTPSGAGTVRGVGKNGRLTVELLSGVTIEVRPSEVKNINKVRNVSVDSRIRYRDIHVTADGQAVAVERFGTVEDMSLFQEHGIFVVKPEEGGSPEVHAENVIGVVDENGLTEEEIENEKNKEALQGNDKTGTGTGSDNGTGSGSESGTEGNKIEEIIARAPKQKDGTVDYDALLEQSPEDFVAIYEHEEGAEETARELDTLSKKLDKKIKAEKKKLEATDSINKRKALRAGIQTLTDKKAAIERIIESRKAAQQEASKVQETKSPLTEQEATDLLARMEEQAAEAPVLELTPENWYAEFGEDGTVETPLGEVKMGENQYLKLQANKREGQLGMIKPTLTNPDVIIEKYAPKEGAERDTKLLFVKTFTDNKGKKYIHFESVTVRKDGLEVSISSHIAERKAIAEELINGTIAFNRFANKSEGYLLENQNGLPDIVPTQANISAGKITENNLENNKDLQKSEENETESNPDDQKAKGEQETTKAAEERNPAQTQGENAAKGELEEKGEKNPEEFATPSGNSEATSNDGEMSKTQHAPYPTMEPYRNTSDNKGTTNSETAKQNTPKRKNKPKKLSERWKFLKGVDRETLPMHGKIAYDIATDGVKFKWKDEVTASGTVTSPGLGNSMIASSGNKESDRRTYIGLLNNKSGLTPEQYAHILWEEQTGSGREMDSLEIMNEILDVLSSVNSVGAATGYLREKFANALGEDTRTEEEIEGSYITPSQQKYIDEQTAEYDRVISETEAELTAAQNAYIKQQNKIFSRNSLFGDTAGKGMFDNVSDFSSENQKRILDPMQSQINKIKDDLQKLKAGREAALKKIRQDAISQMEIKTEEQLPDEPSHDDNLPFQIINQSEDLAAVNEKFNEELQQQIDGTLPKGHVYKLGAPSEALLSNLDGSPVEMASSTLETKSSKEYKSNHPFDLKDIKNLPQALSNPIAVFESETNPNRTVVLTELKDGKGNNFIAILDIAKERGRNVNTVNSIISLYPKESSIHIAKWFLGGQSKDVGRNLLKWVDTKKALNWLADNTSNVRSVGLSTKSIAKVIQNFKNPTLSTEKSHVSGEKTKTISPEALKKLIERLKQTGLARNVFADAAVMREYLKKALGKAGAERFMTIMKAVSAKNGLIAIHNLSAANLLHAAKMGGIPVPSIAITSIE
ncbi:MAG: hypothetical protein LBS54_08935, partial [Dysgonamonadaceae bacterium]|nr:hypothetical protein [Dysgonamonadaceae bacterium]